MENEVNRAVGASVEVEHGQQGMAETRKEWEVPKLRKVEVAELTALNGFTTSDGPMSS